MDNYQTAVSVFIGALLLAIIAVPLLLLKSRHQEPDQSSTDEPEDARGPVVMAASCARLVAIDVSFLDWIVVFIKMAFAAIPAIVVVRLVLWLIEVFVAVFAAAGTAGHR